MVRDLSLELQAGEWLALSGPNGCGKTTLLLTLAGLWPAQRGEMALGGKPWGGPGHLEQRDQVAVVMQEPSAQLLAPTVRDELELSLLNLEWPARRMGEAVAFWAEALGLADLLSRAPLSLSAGEEQRVLLASALAAAPRMLLCDEGTAHLDPLWRRRVLDLVDGERGRRGMAVLWATQSPEELSRASRRLEIFGVPAWRLERRPPASRRETRPDGAPLASVRIAPQPPAQGPRISISEAKAFSLPSHGLTVISGPNGSGKSALLASLAGLESASQVAVDWLVARPQAPSFAGQFPEQQTFCERVDEEMAYAARKRGMIAAECREAVGRRLGDLGLSVDFLARRPWSLSSGERRLVGSIGALLAPACLYLLDEPTVGLDSERAAALGAWIAEHSLTQPIVVATQDLAWANAVGGALVRLGGND